MIHFSPVTFKSFSSSLTVSIFIMMCLWTSLSYVGCVEILGCVGNASHQIWDIYIHYLLEYFLCFFLFSFSGPFITSMLE